MASKLVNVIADFSTTLVSKTAVGATTATLTSGLDSDGVQLPTGTYGFTIDRGNSSKEYFTATLTGAALTNIQTVTRGTGVGTSGLLRIHRKGAEVIISDWVAIRRILDVLNGTTNFDAGTPLSYDGTATINAANQLATVAYVLGVVNGGAVSFSATTLSGTAGETFSAGAPVYLKASDSRWYKALANDSLFNSTQTLQLGIANGAGSAGVVISNGVTVGGLVSNLSVSANNLYYLSDTGTLSTSAGTYSIVLGWATSSTQLVLSPKNINIPTPSEKAALIGNVGTPSGSNKFITEQGITVNFGDGSDGSGNISGTTTLTKDMYYTDLVVTGTLNTAGYRVFVSGTLSGNGIIQNNGVVGSNGAVAPQGAGGAGGVATVGYFSNIPGSAGANGANTGAGVAGSAGSATSGVTTLLVTTASSVGGAGGSNIPVGGAAGGAGGASGTRTALLTLLGISKFQTITGLDVSSTGSLIKYVPSMGGSGGGGGGSGNSGGSSGSGGSGGGGGASGGIVVLFVKTYTGTHTINAKGGVGGNGGGGTGATSGGGGGGAGGNGGYIYVVYNTKTWTGSYVVTGGAGGTGGAATGASDNGATGATGSSGSSKEIQVNILI